MDFYFELRDGKAAFAIAKAQISKKVIVGVSETGEEITETIQETIYLFGEDDLSQYPDAVPIPQPTQEILDRATQIQGRTLSKSEFEKLLFNKTEEEQLQETIVAIGQELLQKDTIIQTLGQELASVKLELIQLKGGV
ncbi:hypothetical protein ACEF06_25290 [Brevibacillus agri]